MKFKDDTLVYLVKMSFLFFIQTVCRVLRIAFITDLDVMSDEVRKILSNPEDAEKYKNAVKKIRDENKTSCEINLSDNTSITLVG